MGFHFVVSNYFRITNLYLVVLDTTKVQIFKQITTLTPTLIHNVRLFQIPQRYRFSSKSQPLKSMDLLCVCCFRYHKGTDFQANHNDCWYTYETDLLFQIPQRYRFSSKSQQQFNQVKQAARCFRYHKGTDFQANHNPHTRLATIKRVVLDTTKVQIFKQITTPCMLEFLSPELFQIPQRYRFSSKSQQVPQCLYQRSCCFRYHKGTDFQANHNVCAFPFYALIVVLDTTKVQIFKQITTSR